MDKRAPFSPVDGNKRRRRRQQRRIRKKRDTSDLSQYLDQPGVDDCITNPPVRPPLARKFEIWNSHTKTPKTSNCSIASKQGSQASDTRTIVPQPRQQQLKRMAAKPKPDSKRVQVPKRRKLPAKSAVLDTIVEETSIEQSNTSYTSTTTSVMSKPPPPSPTESIATDDLPVAEPVPSEEVPQDAPVPTMPDEKSDMDETSDDELMNLTLSPPDNQPPRQGRLALSPLAPQQQIPSVYKEGRVKASPKAQDGVSTESDATTPIPKSSPFLRKTPPPFKSHNSAETTPVSNRKRDRTMLPPRSGRKAIGGGLSPMIPGWLRGSRSTEQLKSPSSRRPNSAVAIRRQSQSFDLKGFVPENKQLFQRMMEKPPESENDDEMSSPLGLVVETPAQAVEDASILTQEDDFLVDQLPPHKTPRKPRSEQLSRIGSSFREVRRTSRSPLSVDPVGEMTRSLEPEGDRLDNSRVPIREESVEVESAGDFADTRDAETPEPMVLETTRNDERGMATKQYGAMHESCEETGSVSTNREDHSSFGVAAVAERQRSSPSVASANSRSEGILTPPSVASRDSKQLEDTSVDNGSGRGTIEIWTAELASKLYRGCGVNSEPVFTLASGQVYQHPPLPPGWTVIVSKSKDVPFYRHPDFGSTYFCPVVLPGVADGASENMSRSVYAVSQSQRSRSVDGRSESQKAVCVDDEQSRANSRESSVALSLSSSPVTGKLQETDDRESALLNAIEGVPEPASDTIICRQGIESASDAPIPSTIEFVTDTVAPFQQVFLNNLLATGTSGVDVETVANRSTPTGSHDDVEVLAELAVDCEPTPGRTIVTLASKSLTFDTGGASDAAMDELVTDALTETPMDEQPSTHGKQSLLGVRRAPRPSVESSSKKAETDDEFENDTVVETPRETKVTDRSHSPSTRNKLALPMEQLDEHENDFSHEMDFASPDDDLDPVSPLASIGLDTSVDKKRTTAETLARRGASSRMQPVFLSENDNNISPLVRGDSSVSGGSGGASIISTRSLLSNLSERSSVSLRASHPNARLCALQNVAKCNKTKEKRRERKRRVTPCESGGKRKKTVRAKVGKKKHKTSKK